MKNAYHPTPGHQLICVPPSYEHNAKKEEIASGKQGLNLSSFLRFGGVSKEGAAKSSFCASLWRRQEAWPQAAITGRGWLMGGRSIGDTLFYQKLSQQTHDPSPLFLSSLRHNNPNQNLAARPGPRRRRLPSFLLHPVPMCHLLAKIILDSGGLLRAGHLSIGTRHSLSAPPHTHTARVPCSNLDLLPHFHHHP